MKKDYLILAAFLGITAVSGAVIYKLQDQGPAPAEQPAAGPTGASAQSEMEQRRAAIRQDIKRLEGLLKDDPTNRQLLVKLGNHHYDVEEPHDAIKYYERALAMNPDDPPVLVDCGAMYRLIGNPDKAIEYFQKAIELDPKMPQAYFNLGLVYRMEKNDPQNAALAWKEYLKLAPDSPLKDFLQEQIDAAESN